MNRVFIEPVNVAAYYFASKDDIIINIENSNLTHGEQASLGSKLCFSYYKFTSAIGTYKCAFSTYYFSTQDLEEIDSALSELLKIPIKCLARFQKQDTSDNPESVFTGCWTVEVFLPLTQLQSK